MTVLGMDWEILSSSTYFWNILLFSPVFIIFPLVAELLRFARIIQDRGPFRIRLRIPRLAVGLFTSIILCMIFTYHFQKEFSEGTYDYRSRSLSELIGLCDNNAASTSNFKQGDDLSIIRDYLIINYKCFPTNSEYFKSEDFDKKIHPAGYRTEGNIEIITSEDMLKESEILLWTIKILKSPCKILPKNAEEFEAFLKNHPEYKPSDYITKNLMKLAEDLQCNAEYKDNIELLFSNNSRDGRSSFITIPRKD